MKLLLLTIASAFALNTYSQAPTIQWQNLIVGNNVDAVNKTIQSTDGNFYSVGSTLSTAGNLSNYHGGWDAWISKIDVNGNFVWKKPIGGSNTDYLTDIIQTNDGNYLASGTSYSSDGDLLSIPYSTTPKNIWLIKFNDTGILWEQRYGGSGDGGFSTNSHLIEATNGDLHVFANTVSNDGDIINSHSNGMNENDIVYFKLSSNGTILSQKNYGGSDDDNFYSATLTSDGGIAILGRSRSTDFDVSQHLAAAGFYDTWIFKIDNTLNIVWDKSFLAPYNDKSATCVKELGNGKIMFSSCISNNGIDGTLNVLSANGNLIWQKNYGGSGMDRIDDFIELNSNKIICSGYTYSNDGDITNNVLGDAIWLIEVDSVGIINNQSLYGGSMQENGAKLTKTIDNQFVLSGGTSSIDHDVVNPYTWNCFCEEAWIFKLNMNTVGIHEKQLTNTLSIYPNPANEVIHVNTSTSLTNESYNIVNTLGQTILNGKLENEHSTIDVQTLESGIYFLQIGGKQTQSTKIIKN
ncbi:MAG: T9SS type A sorting domain-containing protein [Bacteroidetes bacterium]|nr:T9SS type A sorting domain-containing protein [Bacteroidota bacterium]